MQAVIVPRLPHCTLSKICAYPYALTNCMPSVPVHVYELRGTFAILYMKV